MFTAINVRVNWNLRLTYARICMSTVWSHVLIFNFLHLNLFVLFFPGFLIMKRGSLDNFFEPIEKHKKYSQPESSSSVSPSPHSNIYTSSASTTDESPAVSSTSACPGSADPLTVSQDVSQSPSNFGQLLYNPFFNRYKIENRHHLYDFLT